MAHLNIDARRAMVGKVLNAGIQIGPREAKVLGVVFNCSVSAIQADAKVLRAAGSSSILVSRGQPANPPKIRAGSLKTL
jgi:hypothetical protein